MILCFSTPILQSDHSRQGYDFAIFGLEFNVVREINFIQIFLTAVFLKIHLAQSIISTFKLKGILNQFSLSNNNNMYTMGFTFFKSRYSGLGSQGQLM